VTSFLVRRKNIVILTCNFARFGTLAFVLDVSQTDGQHFDLYAVFTDVCG
jgi:hypothetical protein